VSIATQSDLLAAEFAPTEAAEQPPKAPSKSKRLHALFAAQCRAYRLPPFVSELAFAKAIGRMWRFDFAFPQQNVAVEIEGLVVRRVWVADLVGGAPAIAGGKVVNVSSVKPTTVAMGRHATVTGLREDCEKYNTAAMLGWVVLRFEQNAIKPCTAIEMTMRVLAARGWKGNAV
jgi:hypothetical protein